MTRLRWLLVALLGVGVTACLVVGGLAARPDAGDPSASVADPAAAAATSPAAAPVVAAPVATPVRVRIASLHLSSRLLELGLNRDRTVEVPQDPDLAGWFREGPPPGAVGSSVILGHVDSVDGPAVFAGLDTLRPGQVVRVDLSDDTVASFRVTRVRTYPNEDFPAQQVYGRRTGHTLSLITCGGAYDNDRGGYQANVVVTTRWIGTTA